MNLDAALKEWNTLADKYRFGSDFRDALGKVLTILCSEPTPIREPLKRWRKYYREKDGVLRSWLRNVPIAAVLKAEDKEYGVHVFASRERCVETDGIFRCEAPIIVEVTIPPHARGMKNGAGKSNQWTIESWSEVHVDLSQEAIAGATPPPAFKAGDRVRSKAYPMWGVMAVTDVRTTGVSCRIIEASTEPNPVSVGVTGDFSPGDLYLAAIKIEDLRIGMRVRTKDGEFTITALDCRSGPMWWYRAFGGEPVSNILEILP